MLNIKSRKKLMIPVIAILLLVIMAATSYADMTQKYNTTFWWTSHLGLNKRGTGNYDKNETRLIQQVVTESGVASLSADGIYGSNTENGVEAYQLSRLGSNWDDGQVGSETWLSFQADNGNWVVSSRQWSSGRNMSYYAYKMYSNITTFKIRHYADGAWYVKGSSGSWYHVN